MAEHRLNRREFHKLTSAAIGGLTAGAILGCGGAKSPPPAAGEGEKADQVAVTEVHLCRGLNECKGQGKGGENACRGQGACATAKEHACGGQNDCKGLGGCGETVGKNECKGHGGCHVPLMDTAWDTLRKQKEAEWAEKMLEFSAAPAKAT